MTALESMPVHAPRLEVVSPHLSHSQIRTYATCSLKWWYSRQYTPEFVPSALVFGKAWHAAVERYYQINLEGRPATLTALVGAFMDEYARESGDIRYGAKEELPSTEQVSRMLEVFLNSVTPGRVIAIEQEVRCSLGEGMPELLGYIDLIELVEREGKYFLHLVDFKTSARSPQESPEPDQLLLYAYAARQTGILAEFAVPLVLRYDYMVKTKEPKYLSLSVEPDETATARVLAKFRECWRGMRERVVYPCPGWQCAGCGYHPRCGKWPQNEAV